MKVSELNQSTATKSTQNNGIEPARKVTGSLKGELVARSNPGPLERPAGRVTGATPRVTLSNIEKLSPTVTGRFARAALAPLPEGRPDTFYDGKYVGAGGTAYNTTTPLDQIPPIRPNNGKVASETIIYVNGISNNKADQTRDMQTIANSTGANIIGIHNSTQGTIKDLIQSLGDKTDIGTNLAVDSVANTVYDQIKQGKTIHLMGHSQGALIISRALSDVRRRLIAEDGMSGSQASRLLNNVKVETFGGAAGSYPDGPQYVHYVNRVDAVPALVGLGPFRPLFGDRNAGAGAVVHRFTDFSDTHSLNGTYLSQRVPFEQARRKQF